MNSPARIPPHQQRTTCNKLYVCVGLAVCCCLLVVGIIIFYIGLNVIFTTRRPINSASVDFGASRFDQFCNFTFRPTDIIASESSGKGRSFISSGQRVSIGSYQYAAFVVIEINSQKGACTGSIIDDRHILCAAHCVAINTRNVDNPSDFVDNTAVLEIRLGLVTANSKVWDDYQYAQIVKAEAIYIHSDYDQLGSGNTDIAVIRANKPILFDSDYVKPVCLASAKDELPEQCTALGFGAVDNNAPNLEAILYKAPGIPVYTFEECTSGKLLEKVKEQVRGTVDKDLSAAEKREAEQNFDFMIQIFFKGKLCSHLDPQNARSICKGDSGGPLMCTPEGTTRADAYYDPSSPLFSKTDPSLKQFGINMAGIKGKDCGQRDFITIFTSIRYHRLWLEFIAMPLLDDVGKAKDQQQLNYNYCQDEIAWNLIKLVVQISDSTKEGRLKNQVCRKFAAFITCSKNSPKLEYCDEVDVTILGGVLDPSLFMDLLPYFKQMRCAIMKVGCGCHRHCPNSLTFLFAMYSVFRLR